MIEINLLPGSGKKNRSTGFSLTAIAGKAGARVKDPFMIAAAVSIIAAVGAIGALHLSQAGRAEELTERERRSVQDSTRYVAVLRERNRAESQRDSVRRQLEIIKSITQTASVAPPSAAPAPAPAKGQNGKPVPPPPPPPQPELKFQLAGNTVDIQALTRFMKLLESSPFVKNVTIAKAELVTLEGKEVQEFLLEAEYERPDASVIATVPVTLSSR